MEEYYLPFTTDGSGDAVAQSNIPVKGMLSSIEWVDGDLADGVDAVISIVGRRSEVDQTLLTLTDANNDKTYYPRVLEHNQAGGDLATYSEIFCWGTLKIVVSSGGAAKSGAIYARFV